MKIKSRSFKFYIATFVFIFSSLIGTGHAKAATLILQPASGAFSVDSTFEVQILVDTEGQEINALDIRLSFPPDKLQVISPAVGKSIISLWTIPPRFDNAKGTITLQGGIPEGARVSKGLVSTISFRARGIGTAAVRFSDETRVLLNDGKGTDALSYAQGGIYNLVLPPPGGPEVASETHPDQTQWYSNANVVLQWVNPETVKGFSYTLNELPVFTPDDTIDSEQNSVAYQNLASRNHYFHIKAMNLDGVWGGITHFAIKIDAEPPAGFPITVQPSARTTNGDIIFSFNTTDMHSGISRYEYKIIPLRSSPNNKDLTFFFVETQSPKIIKIDRGTYDIVVRAYDNAGNFQEAQTRARNLSPFIFYATNVYVLSFLILLVIALFVAARRIYLRHRKIEQKHLTKELPSSIREKLEELSKYKNKYGHLIILLALLLGIYSTSVPTSYAQTAAIAPPLISTFPRQISNEDIFYIGGKTDASNVEVIIYLQNLTTGETFSYSETSDKNGEWFYRHPSFLSSGQYIVWTQSKLGDVFSPPSPQITLKATQTALQFGSSRISYEALYAGLAAILLLALTVLTIFTLIYGRRSKKLRKKLIKEIHEAEEAVKRGFEDLRHDIEVELALINRTKTSKSLSFKDKEKEEYLLKDLSEIEKHISKEVEDIEQIL